MVSKLSGRGDAPSNNTLYEQMGEIGEQLGLREELKVGTRRHRDVPEDSLCVWTICDPVIQGVVMRDSFAKAALGVGLLATPHRDIRRIGETIHTAIQISPDRLGLCDA